MAIKDDSPTENDLQSLHSLMSSLPEEKDIWHTLLRAYLVQQINKIESTLQSSIPKREFSLRCADFDSSAEIILDAIASEPFPCVRDIWTFRSDERLFEDIPWRMYFESISRHITLGKLKQYQALLVLKDESVLNDQRLHFLLRFFKSNKAYSCKWISESLYITAQKRHRVYKKFVDFAIYGENVVFLTTAYDPSEGIFIGNNQNINIYMEFYNDLWTKANEAITLVDDDKSISMEDLMSFDYQERSSGA